MAEAALQIRTLQARRWGGPVPETSPERTSAFKALFEPHSIAIVGASEDPAKWGYLLAKNALASDKRQVSLVNQARPRLFGRETAPSVSSLTEPPDCVVVAVPAPAVPPAIDDALDAGARAIIVITSGFGEQAPEGKHRQQELAKKVRDAGAVMVGPNCMGIYNGFAGLDLAPWLAPPSGLPHGDVAIVSQSGNLGVELARRALDTELGIGYFVSLGNQADADSTDVIGYLTGDSRINTIILYQEEFRRGRDLIETWRQLSRTGKHLILLSVTDTPATARAALSHTGSMVSADEAVTAATELGGVTRVAAPKEAIDLASALPSNSRDVGRRVAILSDGGGHGAIAASLCEKAGSEVPELGESIRRQLAELAPEAASLANPVDLAGVPSIETYERAVELLVRSGEVDAILITGNYGGFSTLSPDRTDWHREEKEGARRMSQLAKGLGLPVLVHAVNTATDAIRQLRRGDTPVFSDVRAAVSTLGRLQDLSDRAQSIDEPLIESEWTPDTDKTGEPRAWSYEESRQLLSELGVTFPSAGEARTLTDAVAVAEAVGYPVVLKATGQVHKSDGGGVVVGISDKESLAAAFTAMESNLNADRFSIDKEVDLREGVEMIIGIRTDAAFGPLIMVGAGGVFTETLRDTAVTLAPITRKQAKRLLERLRIYPILMGARGRPALDVDAVAELAANVSEIPHRHQHITELELNPILVRRDGYVALDARIVSANHKSLTARSRNHERTQEVGQWNFE